MSVRSIVSAFLALSLGLLLAGCRSSSDSGRESGAVQPDGQRKAAPDFVLKDADGRTVRLSEYRGKVVLLDFWATWCGPCKLEIPWFVELERQHRAKGFAVLGVSMDDEGWDAVKPFVAALGVNYRVMLGNDVTAQKYGGIDALPTTFLIDREGRIAAVHVGLTSRKDFEDGIQKLLQSPPSSGSGRRGLGLSASAAGAD